MLLLFVMMHTATRSSSLVPTMAGYMVSQLAERLCCLHACISHHSCSGQEAGVHIVVCVSAVLLP